MRTLSWMSCGCLCLLLVRPAWAEEPKAAPRPALANYFPPPEEKGGWRSLLPAKGAPDSEQKTNIRKLAAVDWDKLNAAWEFNAAAGGATGLLVIRRGYVVGEWYRDCDRDKPFNIYSSSKAYTSVAFGLLMADSEAGKLGGKKLSLDTRVYTPEWLPEGLPPSDPRKKDITVRNLLNMLSGVPGGNLPADKAPFENALGKTEKSLFANLKGDPGTVYNYSNAGVAHLVMVFNRAAGKDLFPFMKERVFDPTGMKNVTWTKIGGDGKIGPFSQGYSGVHTTPREHARFCYLALHRGSWDGKQLVPAGYYDFAWQGTKVKPDYGAQWWVYPRHKDAPKDMVQKTAGARNNHGYVIPSLDLVVVRVGDGEKFPKDFQDELVRKLLAAVEK